MALSFHTISIAMQRQCYKQGKNYQSVHESQIDKKYFNFS